MGGIIYIYGTLFLQPDLLSLAEQARTLLGYPVLAVDSLPDYKISWIEKIHNSYIRRLNEKS